MILPADDALASLAAPVILTRPAFPPPDEIPEEISMSPPEDSPDP